MATVMGRRLGWKRIKGKNAPKLGITMDQVSTKRFGGASMFTTYDLSGTTNEPVCKNYAEATFDALLLRRAQFLQ
jgi:hypothetical protein